MKSGAEFLRRNTGLSSHPEREDFASVAGGPQAPDLAWYPLLGIAAGIILAGFFYPLAMIALPVDLAALLAMLWQAAISGFRVERSFLAGPERNREKEPGHGVAVAGFVLLILVKLAALRQLFPEDAARAFVFCGVTTYCLPVLSARFLAGQRTEGIESLNLLTLVSALGVWLASVLLLASPGAILAGALSPSTMRPALLVAGGALFSWMLCLDARRRWFGSSPLPWNREMFAGCLAAECGALVTLLAARNISL